MKRLTRAQHDALVAERTATLAQAREFELARKLAYRHAAALLHVLRLSSPYWQEPVQLKVRKTTCPTPSP